MGSMKRASIPTLDVKKYGGQQVAIVGGKVVASGDNSQSVLKRAKQRAPKATWRDIVIVGVPRSVTVIWWT